MDLDQILEKTEFSPTDSLPFADCLEVAGLSETLINQETTVGLALEALQRAIQHQGTTPLRISGAEILKATLKSFQMEGLVPEQFGSYDSRVRSTAVVMENLSENVRAIGVKIITWLKRIAEVVFGFIEGFFNGADHLAAKSRQLQDRAMELRAQKSVPDGEITNKALAGLFSDESGKSYDSIALRNKYEGFVKDVNVALSEKSAVQASQYLASFLKNVYDKKLTNAFGIEAATSLSHEVVTHMLQNNFPQFKQTTPETRTYTSPFGGFEITINLKIEDDQYAGIGISKKFGKHSGNETLPILTPDEVVVLAKSIDACMQKGIYREHKKIKSELWHLRIAVSDTCDKIIRAQRESAGGSIASLHFLRSMTNVIYELITIAYKHTGWVTKALLQYCEASLSAYSKG